MEKIKWIRVMCFKHDGSLHRVWDKAALIYEDDEKIMISNAKTLIRESDNRIWMAKEPSLSIYYKNRWFNIMGIIRSEGIHYYCNMATPCVVEDDIIKYIDYDLDLVKTVKGEVKILDEEEYKTNLKKVGAFLGDFVEVGCNSVLNPGSVVGRNSNVYPLSSVRGVVKANTIYKQGKQVLKY